MYVLWKSKNENFMPVFSAIVKWSARAIGNSPLIFIIVGVEGKLE